MDSNNPPPDSMQLVPAGSDSSVFPQQGTFDWTRLLDSTVNFGVRMLGRYCNAGVDPYTLQIARRIAWPFQMSDLGSRRLDKAISNMQAQFSLGNVLEFGSGIDHVARSLANTAEGRRWMMLASSLSAVHDYSYSARVMLSLVEMSVPKGLRLPTPSTQQWRSLIRLCSGILATSGFPKVMDEFTTVSGAGSPGSFTYDLAAKPQAVAGALIALRDLSRGSTESITLRGRSSCGWVAAVAQYFFDARIEIRDTRGDMVYPHNTHEIRPQVLVFYEITGGPDLEISAQVHQVHSATDIMLPDDDEVDITGRVAWASVLRDIFGLDMMSLMGKNVVHRWSRVNS